MSSQGCEREVNPKVGHRISGTEEGAQMMRLTQAQLAQVANRAVSRVLRWAGALTLGYRCTVYVGIDIKAGDAEADIIYISFIVSVQYIGY